MIGLGLGLALTGQLRRAQAVTLAQFADWFLASGAWDNDGKWLDGATWADVWFLAAGRVNVFGLWLDGEAW